MINELKIDEKKITESRNWKELEFSSGKFAGNTDWAVNIRLGDSQILVTSVMNEKADEDKNFLPLTIDFRESYYAWGKIGWASFIKREARPPESSILYARMTDRPLRPMFPKGMVNETTITITPLSTGEKWELGILSIIWASLATKLAWIPIESEIGAVRIWYKDENLIINPSNEEIENWLLDITVAWTEDTITMVECWSKEVNPDIIVKALDLAKKEIAKICKIEKDFLKKFDITQKEATIVQPSEDVIAYIKKILTEDKLSELFGWDKKHFQSVSEKLEEEAVQITEENINSEENEDFSKWKIKMAVSHIIKEYMRKRMLEKEERIDWRKLDEVRSLYTEIDLIKKTHWTALFQRWETQVLSNTTLWAPWDVLIIDDMERDRDEKSFIHHYNMPPFATNEARPTRPPNRREIGHWRLVEKALKPMIPSDKEFPYTVRVVSEVLNSNGSSSMASVCASSLSLMSAWVPIKKAVSGIAMWLVTDGEDYKILTDIQWIEDAMGDMDFKVAGTEDWITALQMDMKIKGLSAELLKKALERAEESRLEILNFMNKTIDKPKEEISPYAPKIIQINLNHWQIKDVIWSWWETISTITKETWSKIDFKEDWTTIITAQNNEAAEKTLKMIREVSWQPEEWDIIEGKIFRIENYGVFVNIGKNKTGLCHVKNLWSWYISDPSTMFKEGDNIKVKIIWIDDNGKIQLKKET